MLLQIPIREKLIQGLPVIGTWNTLAAPLATEVIAQAGFDFQIIDLEHGPFILDKIHQHVSACEAGTACSPLVRIPANESWMALQSLDQGAHGVVVPHISDVQAAQQLVQAVKYYPLGKRGFTPFSKAGGFNNNDTLGYTKRTNELTVSVAIVESREGVNNLDEILEVEGLDIVYFGAYDISQALGYPGDVYHSKVIQVIREGVEKVNRAGKYAGGFVPQSKDKVKWLLDMGIRFITYEVDCSILHRHVSGVKRWFKQEIG